MSDPFLISPAAAARSDTPALVDLVDRVLDRGCVIEGELWLTVADVDLLYLGLKAVLTTPERLSRSSG
ncbi:gas vesicle protein [Alloyangia pacifica]|uniref:Gas vesicle protein n=1 Tax=Alloyangia pacifica TaxID=311180 RepID=A0A2U8HDH3_9RHOB|nr:gas vesicle protein [Alloyangia pacifica]AWI83740.1 gas vesicle protein [Alloyangia pacifica]